MTCTTEEVTKDIKFLPPFDKYNTEVVTFSSSRPIMEFIENNEDPFTNIYKVNGLTTDDMRNDIANGVQILTFKNSTGGTLYIPETYVSKIDVGAYVDFRGVGVAINIGMLPIDEPIDELMVELGEYITNRLGIIPSVRMVYTSAIKKVTLEDADRYTTERNIRKTANTAVSEVSKLKETITKMSQTIANLECIIKEKTLV